MKNIRTKGSILINVFIVFFVILLIFAILVPNLPSKKEIVFFETLSLGKTNLKNIIEYQDSYFQEHGEYVAITPDENLEKIIKNFDICTSACKPCEYATTISHNSFTASVKCNIEPPFSEWGETYYLGYVRVPPGEHQGVDGYFKKCLGNGIYARIRNRKNIVGECDEGEGIFKSISVGNNSNRTLDIKTYPANANISVNGNHIGQTSQASHSKNTISSSYGSFYWVERYLKPDDVNWAELYPEPHIVTISKEGYESIEFPYELDSVNDTITVVLRPLEN